MIYAPGTIHETRHRAGVKLTLDLYLGVPVLVMNGAVVDVLVPNPEDREDVERRVFQMLRRIEQVSVPVITDLSAVGGTLLRESAARKGLVFSEERLQWGKALIERLCVAFQPFVAGGIRDWNTANALLGKSARRVGISSAALAMKEEVDTGRVDRRLLGKRTFLGVDVGEDGNVLTHGRTTETGLTLQSFLEPFVGFIKKVTITLHQFEGASTAEETPEACQDRERRILDIATTLKRTCDEAGMQMTLAGGIESRSLVQRLIQMDISPQIGAAYWKGRVTAGDIACAMANPKITAEVLGVPTALLSVVVKSTEILGNVFCTLQDLHEMLDTGVAIFTSRDHGHWVKGAGSGNRFRVLKVEFGCDGSSFLLTVEPETQDAVFCHCGSLSCFQRRGADRGGLDASFASLLASRSSLSRYNQGLLENPFRLASKLREEAGELAEAMLSRSGEVPQETADLLHFLFLALIQSGTSLEDVGEVMLQRHYAPRSRLATSVARQDMVLAVDTKHLGPEDLSALSALLGCEISFQGRELMGRCSNPRLSLMPSNPKAFAELLAQGMIDGYIGFSDKFRECQANLVPFTRAIGKSVKIGLIGKASDFSGDDNLANISNLVARCKAAGRKALVMAEHPHLANEWRRSLPEAIRNSISIKPISGSSEATVLAGMADLCTAVVDSGRTLVENPTLCLVQILDPRVYVSVFIEEDKVSRFQEILSTHETSERA